MAPTYRRFAHEAAWIIALFVLAALLLVTRPAHGAPPSTLWNKAFGAEATDDAMCVATDANGNVYVAGYFSGTIDVGGGPLVSTGQDDVFIVSYSPTGAFRWCQRYGGVGIDHPTAITVRGNRVAVAGFYNAPIQISPSGWIFSFGGNDVFVFRFDTDGGYAGAMGVGGAGSEAANAVAFDENQGFIVAGGFSGTADLSDTTPWVSAGNVDLFIAAYSTGEGFRWGKHLGSTVRDELRGMVLDHNENVIVCGEFGGTVDFGGGPLSSIAGSQDILLAKYTKDGAHVWSQNLGGGGSDRAFSVAIDPWDNIFACGNCNAAIDFGSGLLPFHGNYDAWLAKYNSNGGYLWSKDFGGGFTDMAYSVAADIAGNVVVTGFMSETVDFGTGPLVSNGGGEMFIAKYDHEGVPQWSTCFGSTDYDRGRGVATDPTGNVLIAGDFVGTVDFGAGPVTGPGDPSTDAVLLKLGLAVTAISNTPPRALGLSCAPNPFNPQTTVTYTVPSRGHVNVSVYDATGAHVATLFDGERNAGAYSVLWDGRVEGASAAASGVYIARVEHAGATSAAKMVLLK